MEAFFKHPSEVYAFDYFGVIIAIALLECVVPRRRVGDILGLRWLGNFGIAILSTILIRALFPILGIAWATLCSERGWGLFNRFTFPAWLAFVLTLIALDLVIYLQHRILHRVPLLWRIHRTHHTDQDYDFSTGARFHPLEAMFANAVGLGAILALGAPPLAVFVSQLLTTTVTFAEHANVRMPPSLDRFLRLLLVTPDMHRVHHSRDAREIQSNFGTAFPWWDRLFGTYAAQPAAGHEGITFGLAAFSERKHLTLPWMLAQPFLSEGVAPVRAEVDVLHPQRDAQRRDHQGL